MRINRRAPSSTSASSSEALSGAERDATQLRVASTFVAHGVKPLDAYVDQTTPIRFVCAGPCGGTIHRITWAALRRGQAPRCSSCQSAARPRGNTHHRYDPNRTDADRIRTRTAADRRWERAVRRAYDDTCVISGRRGTAPHHLYGYDTRPDLRLVLENGVLLTHALHREFHDAFGYGANTFTDFVTFYEACTGRACFIPDPLAFDQADQTCVT